METALQGKASHWGRAAQRTGPTSPGSSAACAEPQLLLISISCRRQARCFCSQQTWGAILHLEAAGHPPVGTAAVPNELPCSFVQLVGVCSEKARFSPLLRGGTALSSHAQEVIATYCSNGSHFSSK